MNMTLADRCRPIEMLILDIDGVLTDGRIIYTDNGVELKNFHVRDGSGLKIWQYFGKRSAVITGRTSRIVEVRAAELLVSHVIQGAMEKLPAYKQILATADLKPEQVCFVGDDIPDFPVLCNCGLGVAVGDACCDVKSKAHYVTKANGGHGAVRETIELILGCQGHWAKIVEHFRCQVL